MTACIFSFVAGVSAVDISVSICLYLFKASSVICKDSSCSDNISISFVFLELLESQEIDLVFSIFFSHFYFLFDLFPNILFLELGLELK